MRKTSSAYALAVAAATTCGMVACSSPIDGPPAMAAGNDQIGGESSGRVGDEQATDPVTSGNDACATCGLSDASPTVDDAPAVGADAGSSDGNSSDASPTQPSFTCAAGCNSYYVSTAGNDANPGTQAAPWKTIQHAIGSFSLGATGALVHVQAGTYPENVNVNRGGSPSARLVLQCDQGWNLAGTAGCRVRPSGIAFMVYANYVDIARFDMSNPNAGAAVDIPYSGGALQSTTGNSVHVIGNYVHDTAQQVYGNAQIPTLKGCPSAGAIMGQTKHGHIITDAQVIGNRIERYGTKDPACNQAHGIYIDGINAVIHNNIVVDSAACGVHLYDAACNHKVANNTIVRSGRGGVILNGSNGCTSGKNTAINNILVDNGAGGFDYMSDCGGGGNSLYSNNLFSGNAGGDFTWSGSANHGCDVLQISYHENPSATFVNYAGGDYRLKPGSVAVNGGTTACTPGQTTCAPAADIEGVARQQGPTLDIGAYEYH